MELGGLIFLSSGLYMGWSLGANDAANIFGTAVGTRMVQFKTAAVISVIFITIGAVISGGGTAHGLGALGAVNALPGSFTVSFAAAATVMSMTRMGLPVSTTQAIVGAIVGWNLFSGHPTNMEQLTTIMTTWVTGPILGAMFGFGLFFLVRFLLSRVSLHMIRLDRYTRNALLLAGAFGAYSLGANNMANVVGVFLDSSPFVDISVWGFTFTGAQQLFMLGGLAAGLGVATYSKRVMMTVGSNLFKLSPVTAFIVILSTALVLFLFASRGLADAMTSVGLPAFPLVPVSQSQAAVGSIIGVGLAKGGRNLNYKLLVNIGLGWIATPTSAALVAYVGLFIMQNVFMQQVFI
ncbi:MAG: anion permease [Spirochaetaceae bacterium]|nr:MAG: anion permease [Spirochaetaceae bacterium]